MAGYNQPHCAMMTTISQSQTPPPAQTAARGRLRIEIHQLEGFDRRDKSFNRNVEIWRTAQGYVAYFQYEGLELHTSPALRPAEALKALVGLLYQRGITRIRTRLNFKGNRYLAERMAWVSHPLEPRPAS
jgi:hypothetical protein